MKNKPYPYQRRFHLKNLQELVRYAAAQFGDATAFKYEQNGRKVEISYTVFRSDVNALGTYFYSLGMTGGRKIAVIGENSYAWILTYFAAVNGSNIIVPLDKELGDNEAATLLEAAGCDALVYSPAKADVQKLCAERGLPIRHYISTYEFDAILESGQHLLKSGDNAFLENEIDNDAVCSIIYTSGTTGAPKGVMLSHGNIAADAYHSLENLNIPRGTVAVLPLNHTFGFLACVVCQVWVGYSVYINNNLKTVLKDVQTAQPGHISLVPLFVEKFYKGIWKTAEKQGKADQLRKLIKTSNALRKAGIDMRRVLFRPVLKNFGGKLEMIISGGAPMDDMYIKGFEDFGITVINGYGITECSPIVSTNREDWAKYGSVGLPIPTVSIRIDHANDFGEGEILVKGDIVMKGYYNDPEATHAVLQDGWFRTGDIGMVDQDGFLYITGREKNMILLANGKNVYPEELEARLAQIENVTEVLVYAEDDTITAEIYTDAEEDRETVKEQIKRDIQAINRTLAQYKQIRKIKYRTTEFEKTTTKKIKRFLQ